jgi:uncharacterized cupin superfamily protein
MDDSERHPAIKNWRMIEQAKAWQYDGDDEPMGLNAAFGRHFGLQRLGIHHQRLLPGRRTSFPHAESAEDEFVYVITGTPDVWLDGHLYRLVPGDGVGFPAGTGLAHSFLNNTDTEVELLVVGDSNRAENRIVYPVNPERKPMRQDWWEDAPKRELGPHDGLSDARRLQKATQG